MRVPLPVDRFPGLEHRDDTHHLLDRIDSIFLAPRVLRFTVDGDLGEAVTRFSNLEAHARRFTYDGEVCGYSMSNQITGSNLATSEFRSLVLVDWRLLG